MEIKEYIIFNLVGIFSLFIGIILQFRSVIERYVKWKNKWEGVKTEITRTTILSWRMTGILLMLIATFVIIASLLVYLGIVS